MYPALLVATLFGYWRFKQLRSKRTAVANKLADKEDSRGNELSEDVVEEISGRPWHPEIDTGIVPEIDDQEIIAELPEQIRYEVSGESSSSDQSSVGNNLSG
jgi:hypothetical protein